MPFNPNQTLKCGCVVATHTTTGDPAWSRECGTARPLLITMANSEGVTKADAGNRMRAHAKANGLR